MGQVKVRVATVTPEQAKAWLEGSSQKNRKIRRCRVAEYAAAMRAGRYLLNGESVVINCDGSVLNGHHRLMACVEAGVPFRTVLVTGVDAAAYPTFDSGAGRSRADVLTINGEEYATDRAACLRLVHFAEQGRISDSFGGAGGIGFTPTEMMETLNRHPGVREATVDARTAYDQGFTLLPVSLSSFLAYWLPRYDQKKANAFIRELRSGVGLAEGSPVLALRNRLIANQSDKHRHRPREIAAIAVKAWLAYYRGESVQNLRFRSKGKAAEEFPNPDPNPPKADKATAAA